MNEVPEKLYISNYGSEVRYNWHPERLAEKDIEYTRTDAFIEKTLRWYCLDCACNDNCKYKCAFWSFFKDYLERNDKALPPKIENAFNPDGSTTENYRYRHFIKRMQDAFIEKACEFLKSYRQEIYDGEGYIAGIVNDKTIDDFRNYMKEE